MRGKTRSIGLRTTLAMLTVALFVTSTWAAEKKLHNFGNGADGTNPDGGLIFDAVGNLYGTTEAGGTHGVGTVFELTPNEDGSWTEKVLHNFGNGTDGASPYAALIFDAAGNLYGTTEAGGDHNKGTVFELTPNDSGGWTEKKLHNFGNVTDGAYPFGSLIFDAAGNLYGTTDAGGDIGNGTVFELTPNGSGGWTEKKLHNFGNGTDGIGPIAALIFDAAGNLYGTTFGGGDYRVGNYYCVDYGCGTVFELTPNGDGTWKEKKLHNFGINDRDGTDPEGGLIFDAAGNLYGTTQQGGDYQCGTDYGCGTVFELTPNADGSWTEKKLHNFNYRDDDGVNPLANLIFDASGNLYGTTRAGGFYEDGTVFELTPTEGGGWTEKKLHTFYGYHKDGYSPQAGLIFDAAGNLYGTTTVGGDYNYLGTVFEVTP